MRKNIFFFALILPIVFGSCRGYMTEGGDSEDSLANDSTVAYEIDSIVCSITTDTCIDVDCTIEYLKGKGMPVDSINATIVQMVTGGGRTTHLQDAIENMADSMWNDCKSSEKEDAGYGIEPIRAHNYAYLITGKFINSKGSNITDTGIISYVINMFTFFGGAHGSDNYTYLNFNTRNGHLMTPWDVLDKNREKDVLDLMLKHLLKDNNCKTRDEMIDKTGILAMGDLYVTGNFLVADKGLMFHFGQYELACYAAGMQDINLSWDELESAGLLLNTRQ